MARILLAKKKAESWLKLVPVLQGRDNTYALRNKSILHLLRAVLASGGGDIHLQTPRSRVVVAGKRVVSPSLTTVKLLNHQISCWTRF